MAAAGNEDNYEGNCDGEYLRQVFVTWTYNKMPFIVFVDTGRWYKTLPLNCGRRITRMSGNVSTVRRREFSHSFSL